MNMVGLTVIDILKRVIREMKSPDEVDKKMNNA